MTEKKKRSGHGLMGQRLHGSENGKIINQIIGATRTVPEPIGVVNGLMQTVVRRTSTCVKYVWTPVSTTVIYFYI